MVVSKYRGHNIKCIKNIWVYSDTKQPVSYNKNRKCGHCERTQTKEGHDGCIGTLPKVKNACCGHGIEEEAYIQFLDGSDVRGKVAVDILSKY